MVTRSRGDCDKIFRECVEAEGQRCVVTGELWLGAGGLATLVIWAEPRGVNAAVRSDVWRARTRVIERASQTAGREVEICDHTDVP